YFNNFSGSIPESIGNLANLEYLYLNSNNLSGSIPESIGNLENLDVLYLSYNNLSGSIPESIGNLTNLTALYLGYNELSGVIPESFGNLVNLKTVYLYYNYLIGPLPEAFSDNSTIAQNATTWVLTPQYSGYGFDVTEIPYVYVSPSVFSVFSSYYSYATISIETDRSWSVSSSEDWLIFDVYSGTNSYDLGFTIKANETYEERSATVKLYFEGVTKSISITQEAKIDVGIPDFGDAEL
ncbi:MAG: leucine-rich repeat domain-containing protein, partial [Rikenellaceae bacterium]